ncbi:MAG: hypothetical protein K2L98_02515, partial [Bacilli bacterium]|nr:hypothetical protein [Bacilli bacterium]
MNNKQMLEQFSDNFVKFRNSFHDILNENYVSEINNPADDLYDKSVESIAQHEQELEAKKQELANLSSNVNLSSEEEEYQKTRLEAEIKDLEDRKKIDQEYAEESSEKYYGDREEMRNKLKTCIETMRKAIGAQDVFGTTMSRIDVLKAEIESQIKSLSYQMQTLLLEEKDAKGMDEKKDLRVQRAKLAAESGRLTALLD